MFKLFAIAGTAGLVVGAAGNVALDAANVEAAPPPIPPTSAEVVRVVDGDTIVVSINGIEERVRLIGVDAPELDAAGGPEARGHLAEILTLDTVWLTEGGDGEDRDHYGRLLRYVTDGSPQAVGFDAGRTMLEDGYAVARYDSRDGYGRHWLEDEYIAADAASPQVVGEPARTEDTPADPQPDPAPQPAPAPQSAPATAPQPAPPPTPAPVENDNPYDDGGARNEDGSCPPGGCTIPDNPDPDLNNNPYDDGGPRNPDGSCPPGGCR